MVVVVGSGCEINRPPGSGQIRYRDEIFPTVGVTSNIQYATSTGLDGQPQNLALDLYQPNGDTAQRRPAIVYVHGGSFRTGSKTSGNVVDLSTTLAKRGYVAVSINYRLLGTSRACTPPPNQVCENATTAAQHDAQAAIRWLRAHADQYRIDTERIAIGGISAGGITAFLVATNWEDVGTSGNPGFSSRALAGVSIAGGLPTNATIDSSDSPMLFFHGTEDNVVPAEWTVQNAVAMLRARVVAVWQPIIGAGHVDYVENRERYREQSAYYLYYALDLKNAGSSPHSLKRIELEDGREVSAR